MPTAILVRAVSALSMIAATAAAAPATGPRLLVVNQGNHTVSIVDPVARRQVAVLDEQQTTMHGHEIAVSPDGRTAYVPIYGNVGVGNPGLNGNEMVVFDVPSGQIKGRVDFGSEVRPHCPIYDRNKNLLYVTTELDKSVTIIDPKTLKIVGKIPTGAAESHMLAITSDGKRGYTANVHAGSVSVLDLENRKTIAVIPVSGMVQRIALSRDGKWAFTSDHTQSRMAAIDTSTNKIAHWIDLPGKGYGSAATPDNKYLLVPIENRSDVVMIDLNTMKIAKSIPVVKSPQELLIDPSGKYAYVASPPEGKVAVIDIAEGKMVSTVDVGPGPDGLAYIP